MRLRVGHQHSQFWPILARFMDYYSLFWGQRVISRINEPWGAFMCRSSILAVLADSDPFRGLLLTICLVNKRFPWLLIPGMRLRVGHQESQFQPIMDHFLDCFSVLGSRSNFLDCRTPGCVYVSVMNTLSFGQFCPVSWTITH